jgi:xylitol oxidase
MSVERTSTGGNWAGNYEYRAAGLLTPTTGEEVQEIAAATPNLRVLGSRHSFNDVADTRGALLSLAALDPAIEVDSAARIVSVGGGVRYGDLARVLDAQGWALHNLASLPHISVAGAVATGTHGSGDGNGSLATAVRAVELVTSEGERVTLAVGDPDFDGAVVSVGTLGVVTRLELAIEPSYRAAQRVYVGVPWSVIDEDFDAIMSAAYSVSIFTDWSAEGPVQVWQKYRVGRDQTAGDLPLPPAGGRPATERMHPIAGIDAVNCTEQLGIAGAWFDRLPHFRLDFTPSNGEEIQSEFLVPRSRALEAIAAVREVSAVLTPLIQVGEIRSVAADGLWLSGASGRDTIALHFTWIKDQQAVLGALETLESALAPFDARPHWGKVFLSSPADIERLYPKLPDFRALADRLDPRRAFRNDFTSRYLFPAG